MIKLIIGISGASGVVIAIELLKKLKQIENIETHLVITESAALNFQYETDFNICDIKKMVNFTYDIHDISASIASGSFITNGMIVVPCSMKTVAGIASGYAENLLLRAADVCIKENRKIVVVPREMPLNRIHLRNLKELADNGVIIIPPLLTFYNKYSTIQQQIDHIVGKILMQFNLPSSIPEWTSNMNYKIKII